MYDALLFDMDGVLLAGRGTDSALYHEATRAVFADAGVEVPDGLLDEHPGSHEAVLAAADGAGLDTDAFWAARESTVSDLEHERLAAGDRAPYDDVAVLDDLATDHRLGVVSNNRQKTVEFVADWAGFADAVSALTGRAPTVEGYERQKPDPHYLHETLSELGVDDPGAALYVGDRENDLVAADNAGMDGAFIRRPHNRDVELGRVPEYEIESLRALRDLETSD